MKLPIPSDLDGRSALILSDFLYDLADAILTKYDSAIRGYYAEAWLARSDEATSSTPRWRLLHDNDPDLPF